MCLFSSVSNKVSPGPMTGADRKARPVGLSWAIYHSYPHGPIIFYSLFLFIFKVQEEEKGRCYAYFDSCFCKLFFGLNKMENPFDS